MASRTATIALALIALVPAIASAERSVGVTVNSDTKTHFVWTGADKNPNKSAYLVVQKGGSTYGWNLPDKLDVTFMKQDLAEIKWCSYVSREDDMDIKRCKPSQALKPGGEIRIK